MIEEKKTNAILKFLSYLWGPIPWIIEAAVILSAVILSAVVGHWPDFIIILLLLAANAVVGFTEERQAGNAVAALKAHLAITASVKCDGTWAGRPSRELVQEAHPGFRNQNPARHWVRSQGVHLFMLELSVRIGRNMYSAGDSSRTATSLPIARGFSVAGFVVG